MSAQQCNGRHGVSECVVWIRGRGTSQTGSVFNPKVQQAIIHGIANKANKAGRERATAETNKLVEHEETRDENTLDDTGEQRRSGNQGDKHTCLKMELRVETIELMRDPEVKLTTTQT